MQFAHKVCKSEHTRVCFVLGTFLSCNQCIFDWNKWIGLKFSSGNRTCMKLGHFDLKQTVLDTGTRNLMLGKR